MQALSSSYKGYICLVQLIRILQGFYNAPVLPGQIDTQLFKNCLETQQWYDFKKEYTKVDLWYKMQDCVKWLS